VEGEGLAAVVAEGAVLVSVCLVVLVHADATNRTATRAARAARCRAVALGTRMDEDPIRSTRSRLLILPITILPRSAGGGGSNSHRSMRPPIHGNNADLGAAGRTRVPAGATEPAFVAAPKSPCVDIRCGASEELTGWVDSLT